MDPNLYTAARNGDLDHLQNLRPEQVSQLAPNRNTLLLVATEFRKLEFARAVVAIHRPLLWQRNATGDAPLHVAAREGLVGFVELFIGCREMLRMVNWEGDTALHCAARVGSLELVEKLALADPGLCSMDNNGGESALYLAVAAGYWEVPPIIIQHAGQLASYNGANGLTALHPALFYPNYAIEKIGSLVGWRKEMIKVQDALGLTPLHYAALYGRTEAIKLFLQEESSAIYILDANGGSALHIAAFRGHIDVMEEILNSCPDSCYLVDNKGRTALHAAVLGDQRKAIKFILQRPMLATLMIKPDGDGNMPLHLAALFKLYDVIEILAKSSHVNLNFKNKEFLTALDVYNKHDEEGLRAAVTRYLLNSSTGTMTMQHLAEKEIKRMNREGKIDIPPSDSESTKIWETSFMEKKNALKVNLLVATLVATVTFAAGFSMPGGYFENKGNTILTSKAAFQVFVIFNTVAFCCSVFAVLLQFHTSLTDHQQRVRYMGIASSFTTVAILAMVVAFAAGTHVVLTRSMRFSLTLTPWIICASFAYLYFALPFCDPGVEGFLFLKGPQKFVRDIIVRYIRYEAE